MFYRLNCVLSIVLLMFVFGVAKIAHAEIVCDFDSESVQYDNGENPDPDVLTCNPYFDDSSVECAETSRIEFTSFNVAIDGSAQGLELDEYDGENYWDCDITTFQALCTCISPTGCLEGDLPGTVRVFPANEYNYSNILVDVDTQGTIYCPMEQEETNGETFEMTFNAYEQTASCGGAAHNYTVEEDDFDGSMCAQGTQSGDVDFPDYGERVEWQCVNGGQSVTCYASRDSMNNTPTSQALGVAEGHIYFDDNHNDKRDEGEEGVEDIKIKLKYAGPDGRFNTGDDVKYKDKTNKRGKYKFEDLNPGRYRVQIEDGEMMEFYLTAEKDKVNGRSIFSLREGETKERDFGYDRDRDHKGRPKNNNMNFLRSGFDFSIKTLVQYLIDVL